MNRVSVAAVMVMGCAALPRWNGPIKKLEGVHVVEQDGRRMRVGPYWGSDCVRIGATANQISDGDAAPTTGPAPALSQDPADQVLRLVCVERIWETNNSTRNVQHFRFDEVFFDDFTASMMLVQCLLSEDCLDSPHVPRPRTRVEQPPPHVSNVYEVAMMRWYAEHVDPANVSRRLAGLGLRPDAQRSYLQLLDTARTGVVEMSDMLTGEGKHLFLDPVYEVRARRAASIERSAEHVDKLAVLIDRFKAERRDGSHRVSEETVAQLSQLRQAYRKSCNSDCTKHPIFLSITTQLFWAHVSRADVVAAVAEARLLASRSSTDAEISGLTAAQEIEQLQTKLIDAEISRTRRVADARDRGLDVESARSTAAGSVLDLGDGNYVYRWQSHYAIAWESLVPSHQIQTFEGKLARVESRGGHATVSFVDEIRSWSEDDEETCRETDKVDRITRRGEVIYREQCKTVNKTTRHEFPPITMRASEVGGLLPGDEVHILFTTMPDHARVDGRVAWVRRGSALVRLRDVSI